MTAAPAVRIVEVNQGDDPFGTDLIGRSRLVQGDATPSTVSLSANVTYDTPQLRVGITSLVTPRLVADIVVGTGETIVRKQQQVLGGYDRTNYVTGRLWVERQRRREDPRFGGRAQGRPRDRRERRPCPDATLAPAALRLRKLRDIDRPRVLVAAALAAGS